MDQNQGQNADQEQLGHILGSIQMMVDEHNGSLQPKFNLLEEELPTQEFQQILELPEQLREYPPENDLIWAHVVRVAAAMDHLEDYRVRAQTLMDEYNHLVVAENDLAQQFPAFVHAIDLLARGRVIARLHWVKLISALTIDDLASAKQERDWMRDHQINIPDDWISMFPQPLDDPLTFDFVVELLDEWINNKQVLINLVHGNNMPDPFEELETLLKEPQMRRFLALRPWQRQQPPLQPLGEHPQPPNAAAQWAQDFIRQAMAVARAYFRIFAFAEDTTTIGDLVNDPSCSDQLVVQLVRLRDQFSNMNPVISASHGPRPAIPNSQAAARVHHFQLRCWQFNTIYDLLVKARTIYRLSFIKYYFAVQAGNQEEAQNEFQWLQNLAIQLPANNDQFQENLVQTYNTPGHEVQMPPEQHAEE